MDPSTSIELISIILLIALSAFFSSAETAFTSVDKIQILTLADNGNKRAKLVLWILDHQTKMLSAILIGNNIVNIAASAIATTVALQIFGEVGTGIATFVLTFLLLIFGEVTPKTMATIHARNLTLTLAPIIRFCMFFLTPVVIVINALCAAVLKVLHVDNTKRSHKITSKELRTIAHVSHKQGGIASTEKQMIDNLFDFRSAQAKDAMIPQIDMTMIDIDSSYEEVIKTFEETKFSRLPIFEENPDNVVGILYSKDLFLSLHKDEEFKKHFKMMDLAREPFFTFETKNTAELFREMQKNSTSIAIVLDEYGAVAGMITTEDLIEEIVGEIHDEYDTDEQVPFQKVKDGLYKIDATYKLEDINERIGCKLESEDNDSIGGLIIEKMDRFPVVGDKVTIEGLDITIAKASPNRIERILLKVPEDEASTQEIAQ